MQTSTTARATVALACVAAAAALYAQAPENPETPSFEVASIRQNTSGDTRASIRALPGGRVTVTNMTLRRILRTAYNLPDFQIVGGPDWVDSDHWDIVAGAAGDPTPQQMLPMLQRLLADRLGLAVHTEVRERPIYTLQLDRDDGRLGSRLQRSDVDCEALYAAAKAQGGTPPQRADGRPTCGTRRGPGTMMASTVSMAQLSQNLAQMVERPVVDATGLDGGWDLDLDWTAEQPAAPPGERDAVPTAPDGASLFTALREQLGLKLTAGRGPVDVLVIDAVERPSQD